jgi:hypothetical protein
MRLYEHTDPQALAEFLGTESQFRVLINTILSGEIIPPLIEAYAEAKVDDLSIDNWSWSEKDFNWESVLPALLPILHQHLSTVNLVWYKPPPDQALEFVQLLNTRLPTMKQLQELAHFISSIRMLPKSLSR